MSGDSSRGRLLVFSIVALKFLLHVFTAPGYGYFRDEFYYIACSNHLAFGYVDQPPLSIFLLWIQRVLLGDSLYALRFLPAVAGALFVYVTGRITRELGGGVAAQALAMIAALVAPHYLGTNHYYSMNSFDMLLWALAIHQALRALRLQTTSSWIVLGLLLGLGLLNKISVLWLGAGLFVALICTGYRRLLLTRGPWIAAVVAGLLFAPYVLWQMQNDWATLEFMRNATTQKMAATNVIAFFREQVDNMHLLSLPLWITGLIYCFVSAEKRMRVAGWIYLTACAILLASPASRAGYLAPAYPPLFAAGSIALERRLAGGGWRRVPIPAYALVLLVTGAFLLPFAIPVLPVDSYIEYARKMGVAPSTEERKEIGDLPQFYADMFGWKEITQQVSDVYHSLPPEEQEHARIFGNNYGEAGAIAFFGRDHGLPPPISSHNNYWIWGPGDFDGRVLIIIGGDAESKQERFEEVEEAGITDCQHCMPYENHATIFVCRGLKGAVPEVWQRIKHYN